MTFDTGSFLKGDGFNDFIRCFWGYMFSNFFVGEVCKITVVIFFNIEVVISSLKNNNKGVRDEKI